MAVPIEVTTNAPTVFVTNTSRYAESTVLLWGDQKVVTFAIYKRGDSTAASSTDKFTVVSPGEEYRPDVTSVRAYGTPDFWWRILEANSINDIFNYKSGLNIRIPSTL